MSETEEKPAPPPAFRIEGDRAALFGALAKARKAFAPLTNNQTGEVVKDGKKLYEYDYSDLESVQSATAPALADCGLVITQPWWSDGEGYVSSTILAHETGAMMVTETWFRQPGDWQKTGSALSYIKRYQWCAILGISAKDDDDGAAASKGNGNGASAPARQAMRAPQTAPKPAPRPSPAANAATEAQITDILEVAGELGLDSPGIESFMQTALGYTCGSSQLSTSDAKKLLEAMVGEQSKRAAS